MRDLSRLVEPPPWVLREFDGWSPTLAEIRAVRASAMRVRLAADRARRFGA